MSIFVEYVDHAEIVTFTQSIIIEVVAGGDLDAAGAEFRVDVVIGDDGYPSIAKRKQDFLADQMLISLIGWIHRDGGISQHGLWSSSGNHENL